MSTLIPPVPIFFVHTLYLPPTTGTMRMPAVRIPGGLSPSGLGVRISADCGVCGDSTGEQAVLMAIDAVAAPRKRRRSIGIFITPPECEDPQHSYGANP